MTDAKKKDDDIPTISQANAILIKESINEMQHIIASYEIPFLEATPESSTQMITAIATIYAAKLAARSNVQLAERLEDAVNSLTRQIGTHPDFI